MMKEIKLDAVEVVAKNGRNSILVPIIVKLIFFTWTITLAMALFYNGVEIAGIAVYVKEVLEFALFIFYLVKRRRKRA